jgi:hypothetical protein
MPTSRDRAIRKTRTTSNAAETPRNVGSASDFALAGRRWSAPAETCKQQIPSVKKEGPQYKNRLFHNNGDGTFTDVTDKAGTGGDGYDMGAVVGDFDNDGHPDLYVLGLTKNHLYHINGDGTSTGVADKARVGGGMYYGKKM